MKKIQWGPLFVSLLISIGLPAIVSSLTSNSTQVYEMIYRPPLSPPSWVFPVVWTILYTLMGIAAYLIYTSDAPDKDEALRLYVIQLIVNVIWPIIFFNWNAYLLAFTWLLLLWYLVFMMYKKFKAINPVAGWLILPYLLWITFAGYLNLAIVLYYL